MTYITMREDLEAMMLAIPSYDTNDYYDADTVRGATVLETEEDKVTVKLQSGKVINLHSVDLDYYKEH